MTKTKETIQKVDLTQCKNLVDKPCYVSCLILTHHNKILLQQRGENWDHFPGYLSTFGGRIEADETPIQALVRELQEELGAQVNEREVVVLGAITEKMTNYTEIIYVFFWHDRHNTIKGCQEGEARYYDNIESVFTHPKITDDVSWLLSECQRQNLLNLNDK